MSMRNSTSSPLSSRWARFDQVASVTAPSSAVSSTAVNAASSNGSHSTAENAPPQVTAQRDHLRCRDTLGRAKLNVMCPLVASIEAKCRAQDHRLTESSVQATGEKCTTEAEPTPEELGLPRQGGEDVNRFFGNAG